LSVTGQPQLPGYNLMAGGATKLFKARHLMFFIVGAIRRLYLRDYVHGSKQRDAAFETFTHFFAAFVESQLAARADGMAIVAVVVFENVSGQLIGGFAGKVRVFLRLRVIVRLLLRTVLNSWGRGGNIRESGRRKRCQPKAACQYRENRERPAPRLIGEQQAETFAKASFKVLLVGHFVAHLSPSGSDYLNSEPISFAKIFSDCVVFLAQRLFPMCWFPSKKV